MRCTDSTKKGWEALTRAITQHSPVRTNIHFQEVQERTCAMEDCSASVSYNGLVLLIYERQEETEKHDSHPVSTQHTEKTPAHQPYLFVTTKKKTFYRAGIVSRHRKTLKKNTPDILRMKTVKAAQYVYAVNLRIKLPTKNKITLQLCAIFRILKIYPDDGKESYQKYFFN
ncbi:hypothetical protein [Chitinophaga sp. HK235]|uniref:hypothetical protein n=1 Tax=Chitinophaga sp. HK235 TaxID=2952571 RepID=UPI001BA653A0|nr:hypothetical protein [Chitinophaga sp. HK235]